MPGTQPHSQAIQALRWQTVFLHDWWLIEVELNSKGRRLGVGGFASRERQAIRSFQSAAIAKRHDGVTLETVDGFMITISSSINRSRTLESGFPPEVCNRFLSGFPYDWEEYVGRCFGEEYAHKADPSRTSSINGFSTYSDDGTDSSLTMSLDDLPMTRIRDLLMSSNGDSRSSLVGKCISNYIPRKDWGNPKDHNASKFVQKSKDKDGLHSIDAEIEKTPKISTVRETSIYGNSDGRVTTRSMTRSNNLRNKQPKNI